MIKKNRSDVIGVAERLQYSTFIPPLPVLFQSRSSSRHLTRIRAYPYVTWV